MEELILPEEKIASEKDLGLIDERRWEEVLAKPDWYLTLVPEIEKINSALRNADEKTRDHFGKVLYGFFEDKLAEGKVALGSEAGIWDKERKPIDTIVIHHTSSNPGMTPERLSAIELVRLYAPYYANPTDPGESFIKGLPISSGHLRGGKQVFYPYHWMVRNDGRSERLLNDNEVGWQAGNWEVNCRSIAIVLDNDYENSRPGRIEIAKIAGIIKENYPGISPERIIGHREVNRNGKAPTGCPGNRFLDGDYGRGWKSELLELLS